MSNWRILVGCFALAALPGCAAPYEIFVAEAHSRFEESLFPSYVEAEPLEEGSRVPRRHILPASTPLPEGLTSEPASWTAGLPDDFIDLRPIYAPAPVSRSEVPLKPIPDADSPEGQAEKAENERKDRALELRLRSLCRGC